MKEKKTLKIKFKTAVVLIIIGAIIVGVFGANVYATTNGYGNIFFLIKYLVTGDKTVKFGKDELLSDKDITLSYKSIELEEGLKIQANRLEVKEGKTKLYLLVKAQDSKLIPLKYEITTKIKEQNETTKLIGKIQENADYFSYEDVLTLNYEVEDDQVIVLKISDFNDKQLKTLEINLQTREITVIGEKNIGKISQIELRKYLDVFSELNNGTSKPDTLLFIAEEIEDNYKDYMDIDLTKEKEIHTDRTIKNEIITEFYGDGIEFDVFQAEGSHLPEVKVLKGIQGWEYNAEFDSYKSLTAGEEYRHGHCLEIEDISYENDIYTVKYIYILATGYDEDDEKLEDLEQYEATIKLKRNENNKYSKYQIIELSKGKKIRDKVDSSVENNNTNVTVEESSNTNISNKTTNNINTNTNTNTISTPITNNEQINNYVTYFNWVDCNTTGIKFKYPTELNFERSNMGDQEVVISGVLIGRDIDTNQPINSKIKVKVFKPRIVNENIKNALQYAPNGIENVSLSTLNGLRWYESISDSDEPGYSQIESYSNLNKKSEGVYELRQIEFVTDNRNNLKVTNFINHLLGSTEITNW